MPTCPSGHDSGSSDYCDVCGMAIGGTAPAQPSGQPGRPSASFPGPPPAPPGGGELCPEAGCGAPRTGRFCEECGYDFATGTPGFGPSSAAARPAQPPPMTAPAYSVGPTGTGVMGGTAAPAMGPPPSRPMTPPPGPAMSGPMGAGRPGPGYAARPGAAWHAVVAADRAYYETVIAQGGPDAAQIQYPAYCPERTFPLVGREVRIGRRSRSRGLNPEIDLSATPQDPGVSHLHAVLLAQPDGTWTLVDPGSANGTKINDGADPIAVNVRVPLHDGDRIYVGAWTVITIRKGDVP